MINLSSFFKDLVVVELASVLAGPAVGMFFAELGAKVIKIENKKTGGDVTRNWKLPKEDPTKKHSAYYCAINWNKQVLMKDLSDSKDQEYVWSLIETADMVISNFRSPVAKKLGMDYTQLKKINPKIIYGEITGYGPNDPRPAFDIVLQAETGFMFMNGEPNRSPVKMPVALIDILTAHQLKEGLLLALLHQAKTGEGSKVSASLFHSAIASLANQATNWLMAEHIPQRMGSLHPNIAPYGEIMETRDDHHLLLAVGSNKQFKNLCEALNLDDLYTDNRFIENADRLKNRTQLSDILQKSFKLKSSKEWINLLQEYGVPHAEIKDMKTVFENELAQSMILEGGIDQVENGRSIKSIAFDFYTV